MNRIANIVNGIVQEAISNGIFKEAAKWDSLSYDAQKEYLKRHPRSKRKITAKPGESVKGLDDLQSKLEKKKKQIGQFTTFKDVESNLDEFKKQNFATASDFENSDAASRATGFWSYPEAKDLNSPRKINRAIKDIMESADDPDDEGLNSWMRTLKWQGRFPGKEGKAVDDLSSRAKFNSFIKSNPKEARESLSKLLTAQAERTKKREEEGARFLEEKKKKEMTTAEPVKKKNKFSTYHEFENDMKKILGDYADNAEFNYEYGDNGEIIIPVEDYGYKDQKKLKRLFKAVGYNPDIYERGSDELSITFGRDDLTIDQRDDDYK